MRYQNLYVWLVLVSALDIMLTWVILYLGGYELNGVAAYVINHFGLSGIVVFKFVMVIVVILICEWLGGRKPRAGLFLVRAAIILTCVPVTLAVLQLIWR